MSDRTAKGLIFGAAFLLIVVGFGLYKLFEYQGYAKVETGNYVNYNLSNYTEIVPVIFADYTDVYKNIDVYRVNIKNIDSSIVNSFIKEQNEFINYIGDYYNEISPVKKNYVPVCSANTNIKTQINGAMLSIYYEMNINLDEKLFENNIKNYITTLNVDLGTERILTTDDLLNKYSYDKKYIAEKIFDEDILINSNEVVVDKNTNLSFTRDNIMRKKDEYVNRIIDDFDNIIKLYIENNYLTLVYDKKELKSMFFDNDFDTEIKIRYLR